MNVLSKYRDLMALADVAGFASCPARQGGTQARPGLLAREALLQRKSILLNGYPAHLKSAKIAWN
jgi:hypothetical protein